MTQTTAHLPRVYSTHSLVKDYITKNLIPQIFIWKAHKHPRCILKWWKTHHYFYIYLIEKIVMYVVDSFANHFHSLASLSILSWNRAYCMWLPGFPPHWSDYQISFSSKLSESPWSAFPWSTSDKGLWIPHYHWNVVRWPHHLSSVGH